MPGESLKPRCGVKLRRGPCVLPAEHRARQHRYRVSCGVYRVDAKQVPLPERPPCRTRGGCCLHPSTRDLALTIATEKGAVTVADVALAKGCSYRVAGAALSDAVQAGQLVRIARGRYALPSAEQRGIGGRS